MSIEKAIRIFVFCAGCAAIFLLLWYTVDYAVPATEVGHWLKVVLIVLAVSVLIGGIMWLIGKPPPLG